MSSDNTTPQDGVNNLVDLQAKHEENEKVTETIADESVHDTGFSQIPHEILRHKTLGPEASFLLIYLISHTKDFQINDSLLKKRMDCGQDKLEKLFGQLFDAGYTTLVYDRNKHGHIIGCRRVFSRLPKYLEINAATRLKRRRLKLVTETGKNRGPVSPGPGKCRDNKNNSFVKNTRSVKNNNNKETSGGELTNKDVVVDNKVNELYELVKSYGVIREMFLHWVECHGYEYVLEKIQLTKSGTRGNFAGFLTSAIKGDWKPKVKSEEVQVEVKAPPKPVYTREQNIAWYEALLPEHKAQHLYEAKRKYEFLPDEMEPGQKNHKAYFGTFMELIGRGEH